MQEQLAIQEQEFYEIRGGYKLIAPYDGMKIPKRFNNIIDAVDAFEKTSDRAILTRDTDDYKVIRYRYNFRKE